MIQGFFIEKKKMTKIIEVEKKSVDAETGEILNEKAVAIMNAKPLFATQSSDFIHIRNDCSASGGVFKVGNNPISKSISGALIAARKFENVAFFTKEGDIPKPQDWVQVLFVDEIYGNLKSTLIKTRSIGSFSYLIQSLLAVNKSPVGVSFTARFIDAQTKAGEKYKFLQFELNEQESKHKALAEEVFNKLESGELNFPKFLD